MITLVFILVYLVSFAILLIDHYINNKSQIIYVKDLIDSIKPMVYIWFPIFNTITLIGVVILLIVYKLWKLFRLDILWEKFRNIKLKECNADFLMDKENGETSDNIALMHSDKEGEKKTLLTSLIEYYKTTPKDELEREWNEHKELDEIGPTVEEYIAFVESFKKQPKYPQTYCECCDILGYKSSYDLNNIATHDCVYDHKLQMFYRVLICRDAYWKIAGEQMGLDKPWEPEWQNTVKYCIESIYGSIDCRAFNVIQNCILAFPTEEMRDIFFENFKDLIEACKEFL